ncbi:MAG TPA: ABC transporter permease [Abditibacteriaceae bacterium]|jgi:ABC-type transport system involved in multi-copper enzyme maturation permease subunit
MASSPALIGQKTRNERVAVPAKWRAGQLAVIGLIVLLAAWYFTVGWKAAGESNAAASRNVFDALGFIVLAGLAWLCTPVAGVIAMTTFQEALRRRWMSALLAFGIVLLGLSTFFTWMQPGEEQKFLRDFGIGFIIIMTLLMAIFLGVALVPPDIERRTIFTILSKPVDRLEFLIGKYLGLCLTLFVNLALMSAMFLLSYALFKIRREGYAGAMDMSSGHTSLMFDLGNMLKALVLQYGQLMIMAALALTMSLVVSNITAIVFCFLIYFGGQMSSYWEHLGGEGHDGDDHGGAGLSKPVQNLVRIVYYALPRLDRFDVRERLVTDVPIGFNYMAKAMGNGLIYVAVLLCIAWLVFSDREF